jgi:fucose 4-O-acetylase-like acetyltransferase
MTGQVLGSYEPANYLYAWIYMFHMPAFVLLAGIMTDGRQIGGKEVSGMVRALLLPYVVFQLLYMGFYTVVGKDIEWNVEQFISPMYLLWFLPALFIWRWLAPFLIRLPLSLPIAIVVSLLAGMTDTLGATFSLDALRLHGEGQLDYQYYWVQLL